MQGLENYLGKYNILEKLFFRRETFIAITDITTILFLLFLIKIPPERAFWIAVITWFLITLIYMLIILAENHYIPQSIIKPFEEKDYDFLRGKGFNITPNLTFEGIYNGFQIIIYSRFHYITNKKKIHYQIIETSYIINDCQKKREEAMSGEYNIGYLLFKEGSVYFMPRHRKEPNFEDILNNFINILRREDLSPAIIEEHINTED